MAPDSPTSSVRPRNYLARTTPQTMAQVDTASAPDNEPGGSTTQNTAAASLRALQGKPKSPTGLTSFFRKLSLPSLTRKNSQNRQNLPNATTPGEETDSADKWRKVWRSGAASQDLGRQQMGIDESLGHASLPGAYKADDEIPAMDPELAQLFLHTDTQDVVDDVGDLINQLPGFFRILDLISERGSGGLVDKVIIAQDGLRKLINNLSPGSYTALTKVDFKVLDTLTVRPIGVYGSKSEIARFLFSLGLIDEQFRMLLENSKDDSMDSSLRSGIYVIQGRKASDTLYIVYWPQDATWMDNAPSGPRRNRITFMRYLTKISEQILCLISPSQSQAFLWSSHDLEQNDNSALDFSGAGQDRLYTFEITTTNEQQENVTPRPGFRVTSKLMITPEPSIENVSLSPRFMTSETNQAFLSARFIPARVEKRYAEESYTPLALRKVLAASAVKLECRLTSLDIDILIEHGLDYNYPEACRGWRERARDISQKSEARRAHESTFLRQKLHEEEDDIGKRVFGFLVGCALDRYPMLDPEAFVGPSSYRVSREGLQQLQLEDDMNRFVKSLQAERHSQQCISDFKALISKLPVEFYEMMRRVVCVNIVRQEYPAYYHGDFATGVIQKGVPHKLPGDHTMAMSSVLPFHESDNNVDIDLVAEVNSRMRGLSGEQFLGKIDDFVGVDPHLEPAVREAANIAHRHITSAIAKTFGIVMSTALRKHKEIAIEGMNKHLEAVRQNEQMASAALFVEQINTASLEGKSFHNLTLTNFEHQVRRGYQFCLTVQKHISVPPLIEYRINKFEIQDDHRHQLQLNPSFIPTPSINQNHSASFMLPPHHRIVHAQLLPKDKILVIIDEQRETLLCYLEDTLSISHAIYRRGYQKKIQKEKVGRDVLFGVDETHRLLVLCAPRKLTLYVFMFDEQWVSLQSFANPFELSPWYNDGVSIKRICCVTGAEEVLLVDSSLQARIYSLVSQRFRPAGISLSQMPLSALSSPDGACALLLFQGEETRFLTAYHWATFGATSGVSLPLSEQHGSISVASFVHRHSVHLLMMNDRDGYCQSLALDITKKSSEYLFKEKGKRVATDFTKTQDHVNNCLVDCFRDVWTRFPVVAAVSRKTNGFSTSREAKKIVFVSDEVHDKFAPYFTNMVKAFEEETKKPTDGHLTDITIESKTHSDVVRMLTNPFINFASQFRSGKWFVDLLCLLPIHIAVARDNRFTPLKDGVISATYERSLLGAEVRQIVDSLSFGWYESILQSYMVDKPVRVVSSMGEQSVGKSYALNHLMDTSFAGSAMRTTEGVWMSITPTDEELLVALDFEGVHSIERSPQEDALLVLFNTAISNLVLFRNNFALSRDITNLFQSFQTSSTILDPGSNPSLFQSTLVIIIKDVVESDQREIVREFSSKFQKMVQEEQETNFISKLHGGRLSIVPWPVIESNQFYSLFEVLSQCLFTQRISYPSAGEFLHTLKTLMAKLKANDWASMSRSSMSNCLTPEATYLLYYHNTESLVTHRAQTLLDVLPTALEYGMTEVEPETEPLKNLDNHSVIKHSDTTLRLFLSKKNSERPANEREDILNKLQRSWNKYGTRKASEEDTWVRGLEAYLLEIVKLRTDHVEAWIAENLRRFKSSSTGIEMLQREMASAIVDLQTNVEMCKFRCSRCNLFCILSRKHDPSQQPHDCATDHRCTLPCDYFKDHGGEVKFCRSPAGHDGPHICNVDQHLCGKDCARRKQKGCQGECTQMVGHDGDHSCSARKHACGAPCELRIPSKLHQAGYDCPGTCDFSSDEVHQHHICDKRMCPLPCERCKRLCANTNHLHGLDKNAVHLCGESHPCQALCASAGTCHIETTPESVEATFTGRHETFQYTKYTQVSKRLQCVKTILAGEREHKGPHVHTLDPHPFHFCEAKCDNCGYFCTLPRGHPQQDHETSHGSMSRTKWVVDNRDSADAVVELNGRRFGSRDDGAPMLCNLICQSMGRHAHIDFCRSHKGVACNGPELEHITTRLAPDPDRPKDWITHALHWRRSGFRDPYSRDDQTNFAKCDSMCPGSEHKATSTQGAQPSFCTAPIFHPPRPTHPPASHGYISNDGHVFSCKSPTSGQAAFHVIFVIDRSSSMKLAPSKPLHSTPWTLRISNTHNNRLGAVYLSLIEFWRSRQAAMTPLVSGSQTIPQRRDAYSVILFNSSAMQCVDNNFTSSPEQLLDTVLPYQGANGTNFQVAIDKAEAVMKKNWSTERFPVVIFLSDGECQIQDDTMRTLCRSAVSLGKPLSFHAIAFGPQNQVLRRMVDVVKAANNLPQSSRQAGTPTHLESSYSEALDSVQLSATFLGIADSLRKTRGALMN